MTAGERTFLELDSAQGIIGYRRCSTVPLALRAEAIKTAKLIARDAGTKPIAIMLSGGVDSEVVLRSFLEAGIEVQAWTYCFDHGLNGDEVQLAQTLAKSLGVEHQLFEIDIEQFERTEAREMARKVRVPFLEPLPQFKLFEALVARGLFPVSGNAQVALIRKESTWYYCDSDFVLGAYRHGATLDGVISFYQRTPELVLSQLKDPRVSRIGNGEDRLANKILLSTERTVKQKMYKDHWPETELRPKRDGGESIRRLSLPFGYSVFGPRFGELAALKHLVPYQEMITLLEPRGA